VERLQKLDHFFHSVQYGSRKGKSSTDTIMLSVTLVRRAINERNRATPLEKDIVSAFNHLRSELVLEVLRAHRHKDIETFGTPFLQLQTLDISYDGKARGIGRIEEGTPQWSPLSLVL